MATLLLYMRDAGLCSCLCPATTGPLWPDEVTDLKTGKVSVILSVANERFLNQYYTCMHNVMYGSMLVAIHYNNALRKRGLRGQTQAIPHSQITQVAPEETNEYIMHSSLNV